MATMARRIRPLLRLALLGLAMTAGPAAGQEMQVPAELQARLFVKILSYDRNLEARAGKDVTVGILVQRRYRASLESAEQMAAAIRALPRPSASESRLHPVLVDAELEGLAERLEKAEVEVLYVTPLRAMSAAEVAKLTRPRAIRTLTGVPAYVREGLCVGVAVRDDRPEIIVNLPASRAEGAELSSQLLNLARVIS
jgi:hypothetical protein